MSSCSSIREQAACWLLIFIAEPLNDFSHTNKRCELGVGSHRDRYFPAYSIKISSLLLLLSNAENSWVVVSSSRLPQVSLFPQFGERGSGLRPRGQVQDFYELREQCLDSGTLFEDPDFPAEDSSIFFSRSPPKPFEWKRPNVSSLSY